jgi:hypothetical protein
VKKKIANRSRKRQTHSKRLQPVSSSIGPGSEGTARTVFIGARTMIADKIVNHDGTKISNCYQSTTFGVLL